MMAPKRTKEVNYEQPYTGIVIAIYFARDRHTWW